MSQWLRENTQWLQSAQKYRGRPTEVEPLRLRAWLAAPLAWDRQDGLTIEGALQYAVVVRETGRMPDDVFAGCNTDVDIPIPIADVDVCGRPIACASWAQPAREAIETKRAIRKKIRPDVFGQGRITTSGAEFKSQDRPIATLTTPHVDFFVRGWRSLLENLLVDVSNLGRARSHGLGLVGGWSVEADPENRSLVWQTRPQRSLPAPDDYVAAITYEYGSYDLRPATTRAPYWRQSTRTQCVVPVVSL